MVMFGLLACARLSGADRDPISESGLDGAIDWVSRALSWEITADDEP